MLYSSKKKPEEQELTTPASQPPLERPVRPTFSVPEIPAKAAESRVTGSQIRPMPGPELPTPPAPTEAPAPSEPRRAAPPLTAPTPAAVTSPSPTVPQQTASTGINLTHAADLINRISASYDSKLVGQEWLKLTLLTGMIAGGHVLLESLPGLAKTTAAQSLADSVHASFKRIQCTPDLLPSDIIGTQIYAQDTHTFETRLGPVHANFVLLDEINRSSAKTQSSMLEAMQERQTTIGGTEYPLPKPFMVIATQNPIEQEGTYRLPEAQLDRFLLKEIVTYPTPEEEVEILDRMERGAFDVHNPATVDIEELKILQQYAKQVTVSNSIKSYIVNIVNATRHLTDVLGDEASYYVQAGGSPRASIAFLTASRALALINNRDYVLPEDIKALRHAVLRHRLLLTYEAEAEEITPEILIDRIFAAVPTP